MPTYISLCRYTQQGVQTIKESPARLDAARKAFAADGISLGTCIWLRGVTTS